jgi:hypothetical protein
MAQSRWVKPTTRQAKGEDIVGPLDKVALAESRELSAHGLWQAGHLQGGQGLAGRQTGFLEPFWHPAAQAFEQLPLD